MATTSLPFNYPAAQRTQDHAQCTRILRHGSKSFALAGRLLPKRLRAPVTAVYAFCREADDTMDNSLAPREALGILNARLERIYSGIGLEGPVDRALAYTVHTHALPREGLAALIEGFAWDAEGRSYATLSELKAYAARVASSVGVVMTQLMGERRAAVLARACDLGVAMQLTNIARDVGEDARAGRLYLPRDWLREAGIDADTWLLDPQFTPALGAVIQRLLDVADPLYRRSELGIAYLPKDCRVAICAARLIYEAIGKKLERLGGDSVSRRTVVSLAHKILLAVRAVGARFWQPQKNAAPCLPETAFLLPPSSAAC
jgi:phytoene synthase